MGQIIAKADTIRILTAEGCPLSKASPYADAFFEYQTAQANINEHGAIVSHPRTNAPLENPFLKIRNMAHERLEKIAKSGIGKGVEKLWSNQ